MNNPKKIEARDEWFNLLNNESGLPWEDGLFFNIAEALVEGCSTVKNLSLFARKSSATITLEKRINECTPLNNLVKDGKLSQNELVSLKQTVVTLIELRSQPEELQSRFAQIELDNDEIKNERPIVHVKQYTPDDLTAAQDIVEELALYELRAQNCINDEKENKDNYIKKISGLIDKVYELETPVPFVFLASSSGTGKTQLTFTLEQPLIYFTLADISDNDQTIYQAFKKQSLDVKALLVKDKRNYDEQIRDDIINTGLKYSLSNMKRRRDFKSLAAGFIVEFLKRTIEAKKRDARLSWMRAQLECGSFQYEVKTIEQAKTEVGQIIEECKKIWSKPPVVFLDETMEVDTPYVGFVRSLIMSIGLALVIIGTNTHVSEFVQSSRSGSRLAPSNEWCYLVHQLPPTSKSYLDKTYFRCENGVEPTIQAICNRIDKESSQNLRAFVDMLVRNLLKERPLFAINIAASLKTFLNQMLQELESVKQAHGSFIKDKIDDFLETTVDRVFTDFVMRKKAHGTNVLREAQLDFFDPRGENMPGSYVNKHIAYFRVNRKTEDPCYVELRLDHKDADKVTLFYYLSKRKGGGTGSFYEKSVMPDFDAQPLSGLCFSGSKNSLKYVFASDDRYTTLHANLEYQKGNKKRNDYLRESGKPLERIVELAVILASHANGIRSHDASVSRRFLFRDMFSHFVRELQSKYGNQAPTVNFDNDSEMWDSLDVMPIPYCATSSANWGKDIFEFLTENLDCRLGTVYRHSSDGFDVRVYNGNLYTEVEYAAIIYPIRKSILNEIKQRMEQERNEKLVLLFDCNFYRKRISATVLTQKIVNDNTNCKIVVLVGTHWSNLRTSENSKLAIALKLKKAWLLKLAKSTGYKSRYQFRELYRTNGEIKKVYVLIQLKDLVSEPDFSDLLKYCLL